MAFTAAALVAMVAVPAYERRANIRRRLGIAAPVWQVSARKVGGLRFIKVGRLCLSLCVTRAYRSL
jgi:hypothetical protein